VQRETVGLVVVTVLARLLALVRLMLLRKGLCIARDVRLRLARTIG